MDQFEAARLKTLKREERNKRYELQPAPEIPEVVQEVKQKTIKEKPRKNGVFTISVDMPHAQFTFVMTKESILSHAPAGRLTQSEIRRHIAQGLKPLLGGIE